jgi:hypothetical protein
MSRLLPHIAAGDPPSGTRRNDRCGPQGRSFERALATFSESTRGRPGGTCPPSVSPSAWCTLRYRAIREAGLRARNSRQWSPGFVLLGMAVKVAVLLSGWGCEAPATRRGREVKRILSAVRFSLAITAVGAVVACTLMVDAGALEEGCPAGEKTCETAPGEFQCVGLDNPLFGCDSLLCAPCNLWKAHVRCSSNTGKCIKAGCIGDWEDCIPDVETATSTLGCETDLRSTAAHCGSCNNNCQELAKAPGVANVAEAGCSNKLCAVAACVRGFYDCDNRFNNGCEVNINEDANNCGSCGNVCPAGQDCVNGTCT